MWKEIDSLKYFLGQSKVEGLAPKTLNKNVKFSNSSTSVKLIDLAKKMKFLIILKNTPI